MAQLPIFILSLKGTDRHAGLVKSLAEAGLSYTVVWGVDGRKSLPQEFERDVDRIAAEKRMGRPLSDGELACALSHRLIYREIVALDAQAAIVLEDDAVITPEFVRMARHCRELPCDLMLLDHSNTYVNRTDKMRLAGQDAFRVALPPFKATGYVISHLAASFLAHDIGPVSQPADWPDEIMKLRAYACAPKLIVHVSRQVSQSHLEAARRQYKRQGKWKRFTHSWYWQRWLRKRLSYKIA